MENKNFNKLLFESQQEFQTVLNQGIGQKIFKTHKKIDDHVKRNGAKYGAAVGAVSGAAGGPVGATVGAAVGAAVGHVAKKYHQYSSANTDKKAADNYNKNKPKTNSSNNKPKPNNSSNNKPKKMNQDIDTFENFDSLLK